MVAEELKVKVTADVNKATQNLKTFQGQTTKTAKTSKQFGGTLGDIKVGALAVAGGVTMAIKIIKKFTDTAQVWITAASDAAEINNKFNVTFDEMSATARRAADELAKGYGIANSTAQALLANTGDMLAGFGATDAEALKLSSSVQKLALDLASFQNIDIKTASEAITKGLLGEREMMKSLGIAIGEADVKQRLLEKGQSDLEGSALRLAKAEATLELAYEQSENAVGDLQRTMDSYANVSRRSEEVTKALREEMGNRLIPAAGTLKGGILELKEEMLEAVTAVNALNVALGKEAAGEMLDYTDQVALATAETTKINAALHDFNALRVAETAIPFVGIIRDMINRNKLTDELIDKEAEAVRKLDEQLAVIIEAESITDSWLGASKEKAAAEKRAEVSIQNQIDLEKELLALANDMAYDNLDYINRVLWDNLTPLEQQKQGLEEQLTSLKLMVGFWSTGGGTITENVSKVEALNEAIKLTEAGLRQIDLVESGIIEQATLAGQRYEMWDESVGVVKVELEETAEKLKEIDQVIQTIDTDQQRVNAAFGMMNDLMSAGGTLQQAIHKQQMAALDASGLGEEQLAEAKKKLAYEQAKAQQELMIVQAVAGAAMAIIQGYAQLGPVAGSIAAAGTAAVTAAQIALISQPLPAFAKGGSFETSGKAVFVAGDNPGGRERIDITPLSSPNTNGPGGAVHNHFYGGVYNAGDLAVILENEKSKMVRRGRV